MRRQKVQNKHFCNRLCIGAGTKYASTLVYLIFVIFLTSCTSPSIYQDPDFNPPVYWGHHTVVRGDTLYSIAWRYGRDYKELAGINGIFAPYRLSIGQRISLAIPEGYVAKVDPPATTASTPAASTGKKQQKTVTKPSLSPDSYKNKQNPVTKRNSSDTKEVSTWGWPHSGPIIDTYSVTGDVNKGVDIAGKIGDPVVAAASGEVVYAGSGLLGYGKLVIVNHSETFLSAYAHNHRILVKEGDYVKLGQQIAELGETGANRPMLHFEIRKHGKPVNPLTYLPKK